MTTPKLAQLLSTTSAAHGAYTAPSSPILLFQRCACNFQDVKAQQHFLVFMGEKEPLFLAVTAPKDDMEGKIQGILQAIWVETDRRGIAKQTELPITETSRYAEKSV